MIAGKNNLEKIYNDASNLNDQLLDILVDGNFIIVSGKTNNGTIDQNVTIKYEYKDFTTTLSTLPPNIKYDGNKVVVYFNKPVLKMNMINNPDFVFGKLSDFVVSSTCNKIDSLIKLTDSTLIADRVNSAEFPTRKIFLWMTEKDSISQSRLGTNVKVPPFYGYLILDLPTTMNTKIIADTLKSIKPAIRSSQLNVFYELDIPPNDFFYANNQASLHPNATYPFADINCESAWNRETGKPYVKVGIYDTGMDWNNSDLNGIMAGGFDFVYNTNITSIDNGPSNHGTSCGGIIGAKRNNGIGVAGIAGGDYGISSPGVNLYTMRIGDTTLLTMSAIAPAIVQGALSQSANGFDLNVMNASWGSSTGYYDRALMDAINISNQNGVAFVASRGNDNSPNPHTPATLKEQIIMSIGATGIDGHFKDGANGTDPTTFASSYGSPLDFMAPGTSALVYTTRAGGNNFFNFYGTSASAPIVSGVTALMMSYYNQPTPNWDNLTHEDCEAILKRTCNDLTNPFYGESIGYDQKTGHGRVDAGAALAAIEKPKYKIRHINKTNFINSYTQVTNLIATGNKNFSNFSSVTAGSYVTNTYEIITTYNYTLGPNEQIVAFWDLHMASYGWPNYNTPIVVDDEPWYTEIVSVNSTQAVLRTFSYLTTSSNPPTYMPDLPQNTTSAFSLYTYDPTVIGINETEKNNPIISVYPNPSNGNFGIKIESMQADNLNITVTDMLGKIVKEEKNISLTSGQNFVNLYMTNFNKGMYFVTFNSTKGIAYSNKIIIK